MPIATYGQLILSTRRDPPQTWRDQWRRGGTLGPDGDDHIAFLHDIGRGRVLSNAHDDDSPILPFGVPASAAVLRRRHATQVDPQAEVEEHQRKKRYSNDKAQSHTHNLTFSATKVMSSSCGRPSAQASPASTSLSMISRGASAAARASVSIVLE